MRALIVSFRLASNGFPGSLRSVGRPITPCWVLVLALPACGCYDLSPLRASAPADLAPAGAIDALADALAPAAAENASLQDAALPGDLLAPDIAEPCGQVGQPCCPGDICLAGVGCAMSVKRCGSASCDAMPAVCGPGGRDSCCATAVVTGGGYDRSSDPDFPATVGDFRLDTYEITVGRYRAFVNARLGTKLAPPPSGAGAGIPGSGWDPSWKEFLEDDTPTMKNNLACGAGGLDGGVDPTFATWDDQGQHQALPMNCISWFEAFAFCIWDGGRLPTEAEWNYAAAGGAKQLTYPWGGNANSADPAHLVYDCTGDGSPTGDCTPGDLPPVGSRIPAGRGFFGHADLAGSLFEWNLDWYEDKYLHAIDPLGRCDNCANLNPDERVKRVVRGGAFDRDATVAATGSRNWALPSGGATNIGARCARAQ